MNFCSPVALIPNCRETCRSDVAATSSRTARRITAIEVAALFDTIDAGLGKRYTMRCPLCPLVVGAR